MRAWVEGMADGAALLGMRQVQAGTSRYSRYAVTHWTGASEIHGHAKIAGSVELASAAVHLAFRLVFDKAALTVDETPPFRTQTKAVARGASAPRFDADPVE